MSGDNRVSKGAWTRRNLWILISASMTESDFIKYNQAELLKLANNGDNAQKSWLRTYLMECDDSTEKKKLIKALNQ